MFLIDDGDDGAKLYDIELRAPCFACFSLLALLSFSISIAATYVVGISKFPVSAFDYIYSDPVSLTWYYAVPLNNF